MHVGCTTLAVPDGMGCRVAISTGLERTVESAFFYGARWVLITRKQWFLWPAAQPVHSFLTPF